MHTTLNDPLGPVVGRWTNLSASDRDREARRIVGMSTAEATGQSTESAARPANVDVPTSGRQSRGAPATSWRHLGLHRCLGPCPLAASPRGGAGWPLQLLHDRFTACHGWLREVKRQ